MSNSDNLDGHKFHHSLLLLMELEMQMEIDRIKRSGEIPRIVMPILKNGERVGRVFVASTVEDMEKGNWNELWKK